MREVAAAQGLAVGAAVMAVAVIVAVLEAKAAETEEDAMVEKGEVTMAAKAARVVVEMAALTVERAEGQVVEIAAVVETVVWRVEVAGPVTSSAVAEKCRSALTSPKVFSAPVAAP